MPGREAGRLVEDDLHVAVRAALELRGGALAVLKRKKENGRGRKVNICSSLSIWCDGAFRRVASRQRSFIDDAIQKMHTEIHSRSAQPSFITRVPLPRWKSESSASLRDHQASNIPYC